ILKISKVLSTSFPTFSNLISPEVYDIQMKTLLKFLEFSPNLESLVINQVRNSNVVNGNVSTFKIVPHCFECLKSIEIRKYHGYLEMVKFVLKHARNLDMVIIEHYYTMEDHWDPRKRNKKNMDAKYIEDSKNKLMKILRIQVSPWASPGCVIKFTSS
ncbi:hypothetical protein MKW94_030649, partial [Papaver nudicaule]|nr:hypothetical protein [Papaver nudicaule]